MRYSYKRIIVSAVRQHIFPRYAKNVRSAHTQSVCLDLKSDFIQNRICENIQTERYDKQPCVSSFHVSRPSLAYTTDIGKKKRLPRTAVDIPWALAKELLSRDRRFFGRVLHTEFTIITIGYQDSILSSGFGLGGSSQGKYHRPTDDIIKLVNIRETIIRDTPYFVFTVYTIYRSYCYGTEKEFAIAVSALSYTSRPDYCIRG